MKLKSLLIGAQNNVIKTNYIKAKIDNAQQKKTSVSCGITEMKQWIT